ncbi:hypothetical protein DFH08DRAFT_827888 [Mycena albidolilacea]|uniref:Uncharacterized protein n=1 Tax=Mycena albidolilacea TaxID=1033008 RepID=A0AAD6YX30_9AGAR|nr:hypothetical protein DFH08DRAFT_827888 [Mycena albidolilacea]
MSLPGTSGKSGPPQKSNMFAERNLLIILYSLQCKKKISFSGFQVARRGVQRPVHERNCCVVQQRAAGREKLLENDRARRVLLGGIKILNLTGGIQVQGRIYHTTNPARRYGLSAPLANRIDSSVLRLEDHDADVLQVLTTASAPSVLYCFPRGNVGEEMKRPVGQTGVRVDEGRDGGSREGRIIHNEVTKMGTTPLKGRKFWSEIYVVRNAYTRNSRMADKWACQADKTACKPKCRAWAGVPKPKPIQAVLCWCKLFWQAKNITLAQTGLQSYRTGLQADLPGLQARLSDAIRQMGFHQYDLLKSTAEQILEMNIVAAEIKPKPVGLMPSECRACESAFEYSNAQRHPRKSFKAVMGIYSVFSLFFPRLNWLGDGTLISA